jgi:hypothetical protein
MVTCNNPTPFMMTFSLLKPFCNGNLHWLNNSNSNYLLCNNNKNYNRLSLAWSLLDCNPAIREWIWQTPNRPLIKTIIIAMSSGKQRFDKKSQCLALSSRVVWLPNSLVDTVVDTKVSALPSTLLYNTLQKIQVCRPLHFPNNPIQLHRHMLCSRL